MTDPCLHRTGGGLRQLGKLYYCQWYPVRDKEGCADMRASSTCSRKVKSEERLQDIIIKARPELVNKVRPLPEFIIASSAAHKTN